jgi:hypothetical protein
MSPEQISAKAVDARTDVFALGIVLWEMLAMRRLFQGDNEVDTIQRVKNCKIDHDLRQLNPEVDDELDAIVKKALAKDPKRRYLTAAEYEKDLRRYMSRKFQEFTPQDLGNFIKKHLETKLKEAAADIKKTLTDTSQKPRRSTMSGKKRPSDFNDDLRNAPPIALAKGVRPGPGLPIARQSMTPRPLANMRQGTRTTNHSAPTVRPRNETPKIVYMAGIAGLGLVLAFIGYRMLMPPQQPTLLALATTPGRVKITIDGKPQRKGVYIDATRDRPFRYELEKPGDHVVLLERYGYYPQSLELSVAAGETKVRDDIVLTERGPSAAVKMTLGKGAHQVKFDISEGLYVNTLIPNRQSSVEVKYLVVGQTYSIRVTPLGEKGAFTCRLSPRSTSWLAPNELIIDTRARRCVPSGP